MVHRNPLCFLFLSIPLLPISPPPIALGEGQTPDHKAASEILFMGPFPLDELYDKIIPEGSNDDVLSRGDGPTRKTIKNAMKKCKVYLVARKIKRKGKWGLTFEGGYPKLLVEGNLGFNIKDKKDRDYEVHVEEISRGGADMGPGWQTCEFPIFLRLHVRRNFLTEDEIALAKVLAELGGKKLTANDLNGASSSSTRNFSSRDCLVHDVSGKWWWKKQK